jgi:hypothetical protein
MVQVLSPNGPTVWLVGQSKTILWGHNLGSAENVRLELSLDGGASYTITMLASTPSDGTQSVVVQSSWITSQARVRVTWSKDGTVSDVSDGTFTIQ